VNGGENEGAVKYKYEWEGTSHGLKVVTYVTVESHLLEGLRDLMLHMSVQLQPLVHGFLFPYLN
jgi:hypothetical protein